MTPPTKVAFFHDASERWGLVEGDSLALLPKLPDHCIDAVVTDPPYGIGFGGRAWDKAASPATFAQWTQAWATECRRVLRPGGYLAAFGAPRTVHRLTTGLEDAGLEVRDVLMWLRATGVPKAGLREGMAPGCVRGTNRSSSPGRRLRSRSRATIRFTARGF